MCLVPFLEHDEIIFFPFFSPQPPKRIPIFQPMDNKTVTKDLPPLESTIFCPRNKINIFCKELITLQKPRTNAPGAIRLPVEKQKCDTPITDIEVKKPLRTNKNTPWVRGVRGVQPKPY